MALGKKLTQARKAAGLTQADVAAKLNVSRQAVSRWESGQSKPSTEKLLALGELYGVSIDRLLNTENTEKPAVETTSDEPEAVPVETVISEKHRPRAWLKYMVAALCGALLMLAILLMLKLPEDTHNEPTSEVKLRCWMILTKQSGGSVLATALISYGNGIWNSSWMEWSQGTEKKNPSRIRTSSSLH